MKPARHPKSCEGFALVVVLSFLVLMVVVALAFFSKTAIQRQVSASSSSRVKAEMLSQLAVNTILGDLRTEILAGSVTNSTSGGMIYYPAAPSNAVPLISGFVTNAGLENLVKISSPSKFVGITGNGVTLSNRASTNSTTNTNSSADGRYITPERWNKPLLLAKQTPASTNDFTPVNAFPGPTWIYVNRDGTTTTTASTDVVGRFAYAIYDEGGLLDANVAGYPQGNTTVSNAAVYKNALAYADLTQIGLTAANITNLVGWRNKATLDGKPTNFINYIAGNTNGFLTTANTNLVGGQSDQFFTSRQQLIDFFNTQLGGSSDATVQNSLQYLTHFSRGLEQPSFVPATFAPNNAAPTVNTRAKGGNSARTTSDDDGTKLINPKLLDIRVTSSFTRHDGTTNSVGDPLVNRKFALNRLAWLTYAGPITLNGSSYNPDVNAAYIDKLKDTYGFTDEFLKQGTPANIFNYFGLAWADVTDPVDGGRKSMWVYDHKTKTAPTDASAAGAMQTLASVAALERDADFFELLKAAVNVGSIAKAAAAPGAGGDWVQRQYNRDINVDFATIQMGANIIDQYDLDGYPTTIYYDDGADAGTYGSATDGGYISKQFHGVESLPYLYRLRMAILKVAFPSPFSTTAWPHTYNTSDYPNPGAPNDLKQTGLAALLQLPEVWNPHDWDAGVANAAQSAGTPGPSKLRVFAVAPSGTTYDSVSGGWNTRSSATATVDPAKDTGGANAWFGNQFADGTTIRNPRNWTLSFANSEMAFDMSHAAFREPTVLYMLDKYGLTAPGITSGLASKLSPTGQGAVIGAKGIKSAGSDPAGVGVSASQEFAGFCVGIVPLRWVNSDAIAQCRSMSYTRTPTGFQEMVYLQYQNPAGKWITYDEKYVDDPFIQPNQKITMASLGQSFFDTYSGAASVAGTWSSHAVDPRTSRFGMPSRIVNNSQNGWNSDFPAHRNNPWINNNASALWVDGAYGAVQTVRPDSSSGMSLSQGASLFPLACGWYPGNTVFQANRVGTSSLRPGMLSQNSPTVQIDAKITSVGGSAIALAQAGQFGGSPDAYYNFYADADGVVRRAMGAYASGTTGLPLATANTYAGGAASKTAQSASRPIILNRPFRSVGEMGCAFSGTPWRNVDFSTPESGSSALLDVFCLSDTATTDGLVAGKVNLNTRQGLVLKSIIAGAYQDEWITSSSLLSAATAAGIENAIVSRTSGSQALINVADLVGRWTSEQTVAPLGANADNDTDGSRSYSGISGDAALTSALGAPYSIVQRYREAPIRALANVGQTRVWNLMMDVIVQSGRLPSSAASLQSFSVDGEQRHWVHLAIDRCTGKVIDKQIEVVRE